MQKIGGHHSFSKVVRDDTMINVISR